MAVIIRSYVEGENYKEQYAYNLYELIKTIAIIKKENPDSEIVLKFDDDITDKQFSFRMEE